MVSSPPERPERRVKLQPSVLNPEKIYERVVRGSMGLGYLGTILRTVKGEEVAAF